MERVADSLEKKKRKQKKQTAKKARESTEAVVAATAATAARLRQIRHCCATFAAAVALMLSPQYTSSCCYRVKRARARERAVVSLTLKYYYTGTSEQPCSSETPSLGRRNPEGSWWVRRRI